MKILTILLFLPVCAAGFGLEEGRHYFGNIFIGFSSLDEARAAIDSSSDTEHLMKAGATLFVIGSQMDNSDKEKIPVLRESLETLDILWKQNRQNDKISLLLAYAHAGLAGSIPELNEVLTHIFRAQNLFNIVAVRCPENIDPRLGRTLINMHLPKGNGRPDAIILEDTKMYIETYTRGPQELKDDPFYYLGYMEILLARVLILEDMNKKEEARRLLSEIDLSVLTEDVFLDMYASLKKKLRVR